MMGTLAALFADAAAVELGGPVIGGGVLGTLVVFMMIYDRPKMQKEFSASIALMQKDFAASMALVVEHLEEKDHLIALMAVSPDIKNDQAIKDFLKASAERKNNKRVTT